MGRQPDISFFREHSGREIDALIPSEGNLDLYEIKSGKTLHQDYFQNIDWLAERLDNAGRKIIIFDGENLPPQAINIRDI